MKKPIKSIMDLLPEIETYREKGVVRGERTGFKSLDELYSIKQGSFTIVLAEPGHGKSEFILENCLNQAEQFGKRSLILSPETGTSIEIVAELLHKRTGKQMLKNSAYTMDDKTFYRELEWLSAHFVLPEDDKDYSVQSLFDYADQWEAEHEGEKINIIVGEPYNELDHSAMVEKFGTRQDLYIEWLATMIRRSVKKSKNKTVRHFFISLHPSGDSRPITNKDGITYYPKPLPRQAAGGQAWYRKSMTWVTLWRPDSRLMDDAGWPYKENEVHVFIDKAKPKGVSKKGMCRIYFDWAKNRYYEEINGTKFYAFDHERNQLAATMEAKPGFNITPNYSFELNLNKEQDAPF
jgi:hypothetical protein